MSSGAAARRAPPPATACRSAAGQRGGTRRGGATSVPATQQKPAPRSGAAAGAVAAPAPQRLVQAPGRSNILELNEHRRGVGLCIYRPDGMVFAARRMDDPESWQMPQGGIDPLENPMKAALRELHEETGITSVRIVGSIDRWLEYSFPTKVAAPLPGSFLRYRGQTQKWYLLSYHGDESEIDLSCHGHPEFSEFCWLPLASLPGHTVDFKRGVYEQVARHFAPQIELRVRGAQPQRCA